jgi:quinol monooxygenase YgiN
MKHGDVQWVVEFAIEKDKLDTFEELVEKITSTVFQNEPGTKSYQWCYNDDKTKCIITEWYASSEAALAHLNGEAATKLLPKLLQVSRIMRLEIYGSPSAEVKGKLGIFGAKSFTFFHGFSR